MRTYRLAGGLVAVALGTVAVYHFRPATLGGRVTVVAAKQNETFVAADGSAPIAARSSRQFRPGMARIYSLSFAQGTSLLGGSDRGSVIDLRVDGELELAYAEPSGARTRVRGTLRSPKLGFGVEGGALDPTRARAVEADLARPFFATLDADGRLAELHVAKGITSLARGVVRSLTATMQVVDRPELTWSADEIDTTGEFQAQYRRGPTPLTLTKVKTTYRRMATPRGLEAPGPGARLGVRSTTEIGFDDDLWLRTLIAHDDLEIAPGRGLPHARSTAKTSLTQLSSENNPSAVLSFSRSVAELELAEAGDAADAIASQRQSDEVLVAGATYETLATASVSGAPADRAAGRARMSALLRLRPELAARTSERALRAGAGSEAEALIGALSGAGHAEAQEALGVLLETPASASDTRVSAAMALGLLESPTTETATRLERLSTDKDPDVARASTLALGTVARTLKTSDPEAAGGSVDALLARLASAQDAGDTIITLRALGNAGDPRVVPLAERAYTSVDANVRMAAVTSVRLVDGEAADTLLGRAMTADLDEDVRQEAVDAASLRTPDSLLTPVASVLAHDKMEKVRMEAVRTLVRFTLRSPDAEPLLRRAAEHDSSADVRELAARALGG